MTDIKDKLQSLLAKQGLMTGSEWRTKAADLQRRRDAGEFEIETKVPGEVIQDGEDAFYLVRQDFPLDTAQGNITLGAALEAIPEHLALSAADTDLEDFDPATAVFMDTETTGLAGGSGTVAFLVGLGYFTEDAFRLEQCFMRDFDDEEPMLRYLDQLFKRFDTVVSYNGKTFDIPLLRTRFIQNRIPCRLDSLMQYDLLHAARRFWRRRLRDCSLGNIEREILGIQRHGDVPGSEIPEIWFDYLRTRNATKLEAVFYHHKMDILSLVALTAWMSQCLRAPEGEGFEHDEDRLSLVRLHFRQKNFEEAARNARALLDQEPDSAVRRECLELMGFANKRLKDWAAVEEAWNLLLSEYPRDLLARIELAKLHEHRTRNLEAAERICVETLEFLELRSSLDSALEYDSWEAEDFRYRLDRIRRKRAKAAPGDDAGEDEARAED